MMEKSYEPYHEDVLFKQKWERDDQFEDRGSYNKTSVEKPKYNEFGECFHLMLGFFFFLVVVCFCPTAFSHRESTKVSPTDQSFKRNILTIKHKISNLRRKNLEM